MKDKIALLVVHGTDAAVLQGLGGLFPDGFAFDKHKHRGATREAKRITDSNQEKRKLCARRKAVYHNGKGVWQGKVFRQGLSERGVFLVKGEKVT